MVNGIFNSGRASVDFNYRPGMHRLAQNDPSMTSDRIMIGRSPGAGFGGMYLMSGTLDSSNLSTPSSVVSTKSFHSIGKIWINLVEARRLLAADVNGTSDPYAVLVFGDIQKKSKVMFHNLDPIWKEEFYFEICETNESLKIYIMDSDTIGSDDFLGLVEVPIRSIVESKTDLIDKWYKLKSTSLTKRVTGELHLQLKFLPNNARQAIMSPITPLPINWETDTLTERSTDSMMEQEDDIGANFTMNTEKMLSDIHSARYLHSFMKEQFCEESLEFIYAVEQFRKIYKSQKMESKELKKVAFVVYERFLQFGSPQEVPIPYPIREELQDFFENRLEDETVNILSVLTMDIFDQAHSIILHMIKSDIVPRFMYSHQFKNWSYSLDWSLQFRMMEEKRRKQSLTYLIEMMDEKSLFFLKKRILERQKKKSSNNSYSTDEYDSDEEGILDELNLSDFKSNKYTPSAQSQITTGESGEFLLTL